MGREAEGGNLMEPLYSAEDFESFFLRNRKKYQVNFDPFEQSWNEQHGDTAGCGTLFECLAWSVHRVGDDAVADVMAECLEHGHSSGGSEEASSDWCITCANDYPDDLSDGGGA